MLEFNIRNQEISRIDNFSPAEKSVEYLIAKFNFKTEDWNGAIKRAIFRNVKSKEEKDAMLEDNSCIVPWEVLIGSSDIEVSVHGVIDTEDITTNVAVFNLDRTLSGGSASEEPSPTVYEQMLKEMQETKEIAQSVRDDADNGVFDGEKGDKGDAGAIEFKIVNELPTEDISESAMYLVPLSPSSENNEFAEYIYVNGHWEYIGSATVEVDLSEYVKKDDYATSSVGGIVKPHTGYGTGVNGAGIIFLYKADNKDIDTKTHDYRPITPSNLDYAVKKALSDCKLSGDDVWTEEEKAKAREQLGALGGIAPQENKILAFDAIGKLALINYSTYPSAYTIPYYTSGGALAVGTPTADNHATTKKYVDERVGSVESILTELHTYAQTKIGGEA